MFSTIMCSNLKLMQNHNGKFANVEKMHTFEQMGQRGNCF